MTTGTRGRPRHDDLLTPAEWKVAELVRHGLTNRRIAERMGVSLDAVKFHVANALSKLGFSGREELRLWGGVARGTALHQMRRTAMDAQPTTDSYMMLGQVARTVKNVEESRGWYREVLGLPELYAFPGLAFFDLGGVRLMLTEEGEGSQDSILYLRVPDVHSAREELEGRGGEVHPRAAHGPPPRGRHRGMDGLLRRQRRPPDGHHDPGAKQGALSPPFRYGRGMPATDLIVRDNPQRKRFEIDLGGGAIAIAEYTLPAGKIMFTHTEVPREHEGKGIGTALIRAGLAAARERRLKVIPICPFFARYMKEHEEVHDLLDPAWRRKFGLRD